MAEETDNWKGAMREALEKVLECYKSGAIRTVYNDPESWRHDDELCYLKDDVEAALSEPPRNCDRFGNTIDAQIAFLNEYQLISVDRETMLEKDRFENWPDELKGKYVEWLFAPMQKGDECTVPNDMGGVL